MKAKPGATLQTTAFAAVLAAIPLPMVGQGTFQNLDFEQATIVPTGSGGLPFVVAANAVPGWTPYLADTPINAILYDDVTLGSPMVSIHDGSSLFAPIQGSYSVLLQPSSGGPPAPAAMGQTGLIPQAAMSLLFYGATSMQVTFNDQPLSLIQLGIAPGYQIVGADISAFSGQTGELRFSMTTNPQFGVMSYLDNIQFSDLPIPEPSTIGLFALGGLLFALKRRR